MPQQIIGGPRGHIAKVNPNGSLDVTVVSGSVSFPGSSAIDVTLQNAAVAAGNGTPFAPTNGNNTLTFEVRGTSASRTVNFELAGPGGTYVACTCYRVTDPSVSATSTTGGTDAVPESWQVEVPTGWSFRTPLSAAAGGNVTITGKAAGSVSSTGSSAIDVTLLDAVAAAPNNGTAAAPTNGNNTLTFEVRGTSASRTVNFELAGPGGTYVACTCYRVTDPSVSATSTTGGTDTAPESWQVEVPAGWSFRTRLSAVAGGNVTITGKAAGSVSSTGSTVTNVTLQNAAVAVADGVPYTVISGKTVSTFEIFGSALSVTIIFQAQGPSGTWYAISGIVVASTDPARVNTIASQTTRLTEMWQFDLSGFTAFRTPITAISGGDANVKGSVTS